MACNCKAKLSWVRGNDVLLKVWLFERTLEDGEEVLRPFSIEGVEALDVSLRNIYGRVYELSYGHGEESNELVTDILGNVPTGTYNLEVTFKASGRAVRSCESCLLRIVNANCEADTILNPIESGRHAETEMTIQMVSSAVARGKNAYELWLEAGNEGSLQDYLNLFIQPASRTQDGQMTKEMYAKLESITEATDEDVEDAWQRVFGE